MWYETTISVVYFCLILCHYYCFSVLYTSAFMSNNRKLAGGTSWLGIPADVQKSSSRFSCFCTFVPVYATWACAVPGPLRAVFHALSECGSLWPTCVRRAIYSNVDRKRAILSSLKLSVRVNEHFVELIVDWSSWVKPGDEWAWPLPALSTQVVRRLRWTVVAVVWSWSADDALSKYPVVRGQLASFGVAVVWSPTAVPRHRRCRVGAVARGRREDAPTSRPSQRPHADPGVDRKPLLTNWRCSCRCRFVLLPSMLLRMCCVNLQLLVVFLSFQLTCHRWGPLCSLITVW